MHFYDACLALLRAEPHIPNLFSVGDILLAHTLLQPTFTYPTHASHLLPPLHISPRSPTNSPDLLLLSTTSLHLCSFFSCPPSYSPPNKRYPKVQISYSMYSGLHTLILNTYNIFFFQISILYFWFPPLFFLKSRTLLYFNTQFLYNQKSKYHRKMLERKHGISFTMCGEWLTFLSHK